MNGRPASWLASAQDLLWRFQRDRALDRLYRDTRHGRRSHRRGPTRVYSVNRSWLPKILIGAALIGFLALEFGPPLVGCSVKANISPNTGERIYHVPGQGYYWQTRINWLKGERWFCSEDAARQAGWRRSRV